MRLFAVIDEPLIGSGGDPERGRWHDFRGAVCNVVDEARNNQLAWREGKAGNRGDSGHSRLLSVPLVTPGLRKRVGRTLANEEPF